MIDIDRVTTSLAAALALAAALMAAFRRLGLGSLLGLLAAGLLIGPSGLDLTPRVAELQELSELGVVLLLFVIGLEMEPARLWELRRGVFVVGSLQIVLSAACIALYVWYLLGRWNAAIVFGLGMALSSTAFVMQILASRGESTSHHGRAAFAILLMQDLAVVPILAMVPLLASAEGAAPAAPLWQRATAVTTALAALYGFGRWALPWLLSQLTRRGYDDAFATAALAGVLGAAALMAHAGLSMALGAFVIGMLLSTSPHRQRIETAVAPFKSALLGLFFLCVGMSLDVSLLAAFGWRTPLHMAVLMLLKIAVILGLGLASGLGAGAAVRASFLLPQCGEFGFVLFAAAGAAGLLTPGERSYATLFVSLTMMATPLLAQIGEHLAARLPSHAAADLKSGRLSGGAG